MPVFISGSSMGSSTASTQVMPAVTHSPAADRMMDEGAFQVFYQRTAPGLRSYIRRSAGSADVADDILQDAFLRFLRVAPDGLEPSQQKAYLYKIASSLLVDHWRRSNREQRWDCRPAFLASGWNRLYASSSKAYAAPSSSPFNISPNRVFLIRVP